MTDEQPPVVESSWKPPMTDDRRATFVAVIWAAVVLVVMTMLAVAPVVTVVSGTPKPVVAVALPSTPVAPTVTVTAAPPPVTVTASTPAPTPVAPAVNRAREEGFMAALNATSLYGPDHISYVSIPGSHGAYMGDPAPWMAGGTVVKYGYKACAVLDRYPNDLERATIVYYEEQGFGTDVDASMKRERTNYMEIVAVDLC
jgi:hypothetical protein